MRKVSVIAVLLSSIVWAADEGSDPVPLAEINPPAAGSVTEEQGLLAFQRIYEVVAHPRCANCHVGADGIPMWSGPSYGKTRPHGMNIKAGRSRIGAETMLCQTCHRRSGNLASEPHAPPHFGLDWRLAPVDFAWFGKSPAEICAQLSDPERNGNRDWMALAEHLVVDAGHRGPVLWGWNPGGDRQPAPYSLQQHVDDMVVWGVAGQPCPQPNPQPSPVAAAQSPAGAHQGQ